MNPSSNRLLLRILLGGLLVLFLMPFSTLSCGGAKIVTLSGFQMATGTSVSMKSPVTDELKQEVIKPEPLTALAGIAAIAAFGLALLKGKAGRLGLRAASLVCGACLLITKLKVEQDIVKQGHGMLTVQWEIGYWLALLAAIAALGVSFLSAKSGSE